MVRNSHVYSHVDHVAERGLAPHLLDDGVNVVAGLVIPHTSSSERVRGRISELEKVIIFYSFLNILLTLLASSDAINIQS